MKSSSAFKRLRLIFFVDRIMNRLSARKSVLLLARHYGIVRDGKPLHRFPASLKVALPPAPGEEPWSFKRFKKSKCDVCLKDESTVFKYGISWLERYKKENLKIQEQGVTLFRSQNDNLQMALHSLVDADGLYVKCKVIDAEEKVENISYAHDRDFTDRSNNEIILGQHIKAFPDVDYERQKLENFAMTEYPPNKWRPCPYFPPNMPGGPPINAEKVPVDMLGDDKNNRSYLGRRVFTVPEPQGDGMNVLAHAYLESLALDVSQDMDDRRWAMTYLFELVDFEWVKDLPRHPCAPHIVSLLRKALLLHMDAEGRFPWTSSDSYELLNSVDFWQREAEGRDGVTNLEVAMEAVKPPPLPLPRKAAA